MTVKRKRNDTRPVEATLQRNKKPVPLTGAVVRWLMEPKAGSAGVSVSAAVSVLDAAKGKVRWTPAVEDVAVAGVYRAEFEVTFGDGSVETFPNGEYIDVEILADVLPSSTPGHFSDTVGAELS